ncbi:50S ribosomal protein L11 methyltransferase [Erythrobacter sp. HKB08]|uniref:50S ribosomal protein L11 methyltransferase n=1 Tax=Erythrobacter sp. HKB08 TaxID=2502843 RepID=UPI00100929DF|nr:50S ribosomal protein L11 methyltransferase [Erythrobacter sp. HKB08]
MGNGTNSTILGDPARLLAHGNELLAQGSKAMALQLVERARAANQGDALIEQVCRIIETHRVPRFHASMLEDAQRNRAYRSAIEALVPGRRVLDIGTGSGLLAMMAARAGAASVIACEQDPRLAATARKIIALNGLSDRITVIDRPSFQLDRQRDLGGGVDCVVSEIFSDNLLSEGVLTALAHARAELVTNDAIFIPEEASIEIALASLPAIHPPLGSVEGFDLSPFARHFAPVQTIRSNNPKLELRSEAASAFEFRWTAHEDPPLSAKSQVELTSTGGEVSAIAQWFALKFLPGVTYANPPGSAAGISWLNRVTPIARRETEAGEAITVKNWYSDEHVVHWEE